MLSAHAAASTSTCSTPCTRRPKRHKPRKFKRFALKVEQEKGFEPFQREIITARRRTVFGRKGSDSGHIGRGHMPQDAPWFRKRPQSFWRHTGDAAWPRRSVDLAMTSNAQTAESSAWNWLRRRSLERAEEGLSGRDPEKVCVQLNAWRRTQQLVDVMNAAVGGVTSRAASNLRSKASGRQIRPRHAGRCKPAAHVINIQPSPRRNDRRWGRKHSPRIGAKSRSAKVAWGQYRSPRRCPLLHFVALPKPICIPKGGETTFGRDTGSCEDQELGAVVDLEAVGHGLNAQESAFRRLVRGGAVSRLGTVTLVSPRSAGGIHL